MITHGFNDLIGVSFDEKSLLEIISTRVQKNMTLYFKNSYFLELEKISNNQLIVTTIRGFKDFTALREFELKFKFGQPNIKIHMFEKNEITIYLYGYLHDIQHTVNANTIYRECLRHVSYSRKKFSHDEITSAMQEISELLSKPSRKHSA